MAPKARPFEWKPSRPRFGLFLGQPHKSVMQVLDEFCLADELGFDHAWLVDHLVDVDRPPGSPCHEAWTLLAAIAMATTRVRIGVLVSNNTFRHPPLLLKQAVTVDHLSRGRLILGIGTGWNEGEHRQYGIPFPEPPVRVSKLEEAVALLIALQSGDPTTFHGTYYSLDDAVLAPRPIQQPRIPLLIAAHRPRMIRLAARYADQWDTFDRLPGSASEGVSSSLAEQVRELETACLVVGREPSTIRRSTWATRPAFVSEVAFRSFVMEHATMGFTDFLAGPAPEDWPAVGRIAKAVIPDLRVTLDDR